MLTILQLTVIQSSTNTNGNIVLDPNGTGVINVSSARITSLGTPTQTTDAATKAYVDAQLQGLDVKNSVRVAQTELQTDGISPVASEIPSTVCPFANAVERVPFAVVATLTEFLTSRPCNCESTYALETASVVCVGVPRLVILALETLITPVPFGSKTILPFVFVDEIVLPSIVILSTSTDVNPFKSVIVPPSDVSSEPIVIPSLASCAFETPPDLILTAPEDTEKSVCKGGQHLCLM